MFRVFSGKQPAQHFMGDDSTAFLECPDPGFELKCSNILNSQIPASNVLDYFKSLSQTGASVQLGKVGWLMFNDVTP